MTARPRTRDPGWSRFTIIVEGVTIKHNAERGRCDKDRAAQRPAATTATWGEGGARGAGQGGGCKLSRTVGLPSCALRVCTDPVICDNATGHMLRHVALAEHLPRSCVPSASWPRTSRPAPAPPQHQSNTSKNSSTHHSRDTKAHLTTSSPPLRIPPPPPPPSRPPTASWAGSCGPPPASWHST